MTRPTIASLTAQLTAVQGQLATAQRAFAASEATAAHLKASAFSSAILRIDGAISPIIVAANRIRQARDSYPLWVWKLVPLPIREAIDLLFVMVENYDRFIGHIKEALRRETAEGAADGQA